MKKDIVMNYEVIEDNGGGLHLYVFEEDMCVWAHIGYEFCPGGLSIDIERLEYGDDPRREWEGGMSDPHDVYRQTTSCDYGWSVVVEGGSGQERVRYPERMGRAAQIEFGEVDDE